MMWVRSRHEVVYWRRLKTVIEPMKKDDIRSNTASLDFIALKVSFDRRLFVNLSSRLYWDIDRLREYRNRWQHCIMYSWKSFEYHDGAYTARTELYVPSDAEFGSMEPPIVLSLWT